MLALQTDVYSDPDRVIAQRLAYAIDHATLTADAKRLHQAADLLRTWNGKVGSDSPSPPSSTPLATALWPLLLTPKFARADPSEKPTGNLPEPWKLYRWGESAFAEEQLIMHTPARWLPPAYPTWDDLLAAAVEAGLKNAHAPSDLASWRYGNAHPLDIEHPIFAQSAILRSRRRPPHRHHSVAQSGDGTTVKQVGRSFGPSERFTADLANLRRQHPQPRPRPIRQPRQPLVPRPVPRLAPRHHPPPPLHTSQTPPTPSPSLPADQSPPPSPPSVTTSPNHAPVTQPANDPLANSSHALESTKRHTHPNVRTRQAMPAHVTSVSLSPTHTFSKQPQPRIHLLGGKGVAGDAHAGPLVRHRYLRRRNPAMPNRTQVHLLHVELLDTLRDLGISLFPGDLGENITTSGIDLLRLPTATRLHLGPAAVIEITGLRTPCVQMNRLRPGLMAASFHHLPDGSRTPRAGIMAIVLAGGDVTPGTLITAELPPPPHHPLQPV